MRGRASTYRLNSMLARATWGELSMEPRSEALEA